VDVWICCFIFSISLTLLSDSAETSQAQHLNPTPMKKTARVRSTHTQEVLLPLLFPILQSILHIPTGFLQTRARMTYDGQ
jgi:hypothetical protein